MTWPALVAAAVGLALAVVLLVVECAGLVRFVRRCDADTRKKWKTAILSLKAANRGLRAARRAGDGEAVVESRLAVTHGREDARTACGDVREKVGVQAAELRKQRREQLDEATADLVKFVLRDLMTATWSTVSGRATLTAAGAVLLLVLLSIQLLYYAHFDFDVLQYLADYSMPALLQSLLQVSVLLVLAPLLLTASVVLAPPLAGLLLVRGVDGIRAAAANALARLLFAACRRWTTCSQLALPLLDAPAPAVSASENGSGKDGKDRPVRRLVSPSISFVRDYGSKLLIRRDGKDGNDLTASRLSSFAWSLVAILFLFSCAVAVWVEPRYRAHAACEGPRTTRVVLDPPLKDEASFTKIGSIGGHVFIVSESCGLPPKAGAAGNVGKSERGQSQAAGEDVQQIRVAVSAKGGGDQSIIDDTSEPERQEVETDGGEPALLAALKALEALAARVPGLRYVLDQVQFRLPFLWFPDRRESRENPPGVTVVPLGRVLCMHDVHGDRPDESVACGPRPRPGDAGSRISVHRTTDNAWTIVLPPDVRMDGEWRLKAEIARRICDGGAAEISEPVLFERGEATPADAQAARDLIRAFVNKPELQGVKLHVLGFASGDGNRRYNENLARRRADTVAREVRKQDEQDSDRELKKDAWGETHLTNGVANSRSARIVGCRREAGTSSDTSGQQARASATSEPRTQEEAVVRWPI